MRRRRWGKGRGIWGSGKWSVVSGKWSVSGQLGVGMHGWPKPALVSQDGAPGCRLSGVSYEAWAERWRRGKIERCAGLAARRSARKAR
jgi:hypothetical protein